MRAFFRVGGLSIGRRRGHLGVLLSAVLVEVQVDGRSVVKNEIILAVGPRSDINIDSRLIHMHYVVDYVRSLVVA